MRELVAEAKACPHPLLDALVTSMRELYSARGAGYHVMLRRYEQAVAAVEGWLLFEGYEIFRPHTHVYALRHIGTRETNGHLYEMRASALLAIRTWKPELVKQP